MIRDGKDIYPGTATAPPSKPLLNVWKVLLALTIIVLVAISFR